MLINGEDGNQVQIDLRDLFRTVHHSVILKIFRYFDVFKKMREYPLCPMAIKIECDIIFEKKKSL